MHLRTLNSKSFFVLVLFEQVLKMEPRECPICYETATLYLSVCNNKHYVCIDCIEHASCRINVLCTVKAEMMCQCAPMKCPLCRDGYVYMLDIPSEHDRPIIMMSNAAIRDILNNDAYKAGPVVFRGVKHEYAYDAILYWLRHPGYYAADVSGEKTVYVPPGNPLSLAQDVISNTHTACNHCHVIGSRKAVRDHMVVAHGEPLHRTRYSRRISDRRRLENNVSRDV
jgi:hypothetical protein